MTDEQQRAVISFHRLFDPFPRRDVQMVGWLVQNQEIDLVVHQHTQPQAALLSAGEDGPRLEDVLSPEVIRRQTVPGGLGGNTPLGRHHILHQIPVRVVEVDDLGQIGHFHLRPQPDASAVRVCFVHDHFDEGGFSRAVVTDQGNALAALHLQGDPLKELLFAEGLAQIPDPQHLVSVELRRREPGVHFPGLGGLGGGTHPLDAALHGNGPAIGLVHALKSPQPQLLRRFFQLSDLGLFLFILLHPLLITALFFHGVEAIVAGVELRLAVFNLDHSGHGAIQKIAVMGNGHHRPPELLDVIFQPLCGMEIQMVGWLVQQQDIRILQNQTAQIHPRLFSAGELVKQAAPHIAGDGQAVGHLADSHVGVVSAEHLKPFGKTAIALQKRRSRLPCRHAACQFLHFSGQRVQPPKGGTQHIIHGVSRRIHRDLGDQPHPMARCNGHGSLIVVQFSRQYFE